MTTHKKQRHLKWNSSIGGADIANYWASIERPYSLDFDIYVGRSSPSGGYYAQLTAWAGRGEAPLVDREIKAHAKKDLKWVLSQIPRWQKILVEDVATKLEARAAFARTLLS